MTQAGVDVIRSAANAQLKELRRLAQDNSAGRKQGQVWLEGDHLCRAAIDRGVQPVLAVFAESCWPLARVEWDRVAPKTIVLADPL
ncbi:MAG TPA: RNA methyltransferase, partial [Aquabacterium sp.]|nr:RNA methyltransferase [Aquabacterium sp.]